MRCAAPLANPSFAAFPTVSRLTFLSPRPRFFVHKVVAESISQGHGEVWSVVTVYWFKVAGNLSILVPLSLKKRREPGGERGEEPVRRWGGGPIAARAKRRRDGGGCSLDVARVLPRDPDPHFTAQNPTSYIPIPHLKTRPNSQMWTNLGMRAGFFGDWLWKKLWTAFHPQAR